MEWTFRDDEMNVNELLLANAALKGDFGATVAFLVSRSGRPLEEVLKLGQKEFMKILEACVNQAVKVSDADPKMLEMTKVGGTIQ